MMSSSEITSIASYRQLIKIAALLTTLACGTYLLWHKLIKGKTTPATIPAPSHQQQRRRRRRVSPQRKACNSETPDSAIEPLRSETNLTGPVKRRIRRPVEPVLSSEDQDNFTKKKDRSKTLASFSRDLSPGKAKPITATVGSKHHKQIPGSVGKPPAGYIPVHSVNGNILWQRMPEAIRKLRRRGYESNRRFYFTTGAANRTRFFVPIFDQNNMPQGLRVAFQHILLDEPEEDNAVWFNATQTTSMDSMEVNGTELEDNIMDFPDEENEALRNQVEQAVSAVDVSAV